MLKQVLSGWQGLRESHWRRPPSDKDRPKRFVSRQIWVDRLAGSDRRPIGLCMSLRADFNCEYICLSV